MREYDQQLNTNPANMNAQLSWIALFTFKGYNHDTILASPRHSHEKSNELCCSSQAIFNTRGALISRTATYNHLWYTNGHT